jgi:hypothetical protein
VDVTGCSARIHGAEEDRDEQLHLGDKNPANRAHFISYETARQENLVFEFALFYFESLKKTPMLE